MFFKSPINILRAYHFDIFIIDFYFLLQFQFFFFVLKTLYYRDLVEKGTF